MHFRQKLITICNRRQKVVLAQAGMTDVRIISCPVDLQPIGQPTVEGNTWIIEIEAGDRRITFSPIVVEGTIEGKLHTQEIPTRIFGEKECFVCVTTTTNFHVGGAVQKYHKTTYSKWGGDPLTHHGHNFPVSWNMAVKAHDYGYPVTFIIDGDVAESGGDLLVKSHFEFGDDIAVMTSSYWTSNPVNFNTSRPPEDACEILKITRANVQEAFFRRGLSIAPLVAGTDQMVGSFGSNWSQAAQKNDFRGQWGACFDHETCDTSVYHEGMPWDAYRTNPLNFRYPKSGDHTLWVYPWTVFDICNSFLEYPNAAAYYNSESMQWLYPHQKDYAYRNLLGRMQSMGSCDFACFVFHDEDHDIWHPTLLAAMDAFLAQAEGIREQFLPATLEEVTQWLDLRYPDGNHPANLVEMPDPLTNHEEWARVRNYRFDAWGPAFPPTNCWTQPHPEHWQSVNGHNPTMLVFYDETSRWATREGEYVPRQYIDYTKTEGFEETGTTPKERLPVLANWQEEADGDGHLQISFTADCDFKRLPLVWWDRPTISGERSTARTQVRFVDITAGENKIKVPLRPVIST